MAGRPLVLPHPPLSSAPGGFPAPGGALPALAAWPPTPWPAATWVPANAAAAIGPLDAGTPQAAAATDPAALGVDPPAGGADPNAGGATTAGADAAMAGFSFPPLSPVPCATWTLNFKLMGYE